MSCNGNITSVARSCTIDLYNICRIRPFLTREAAQILVQALVLTLLDYCNSLLAGLPASTIKPLHCIQKAAAARLVFNLPHFSHVTPLFRDHWLVFTCIRFKTLVLAYNAVSGTAPTLQPERSAQQLQLDDWCHLHLKTAKHRSSKSQLFSVLAPQWWNELPADGSRSTASARDSISTCSVRSPLKTLALTCLCMSWHY